MAQARSVPNKTMFHSLLPPPVSDLNHIFRCAFRSSGNPGVCPDLLQNGDIESKPRHSHGDVAKKKHGNLAKALQNELQVVHELCCTSLIATWGKASI